MHMIHLVEEGAGIGVELLTWYLLSISRRWES